MNGALRACPRMRHEARAPSPPSSSPLNPMAYDPTDSSGPGSLSHHTFFWPWDGEMTAHNVARMDGGHHIVPVSQHSENRLAVIQNKGEMRPVSWAVEVGIFFCFFLNWIEIFSSE